MPKTTSFNYYLGNITSDQNKYLLYLFSPLSGILKVHILVFVLIMI